MKTKPLAWRVKRRTDGWRLCGPPQAEHRSRPSTTDWEAQPTQ